MKFLSLKSILGSTVISMGLWSAISMSAYTANLVINTETNKSEEIIMATIYDYTSELPDISSQLVTEDSTSEDLYMAFKSSELSNIETASGQK